MKILNLLANSGEKIFMFAMIYWMIWHNFSNFKKCWKKSTKKHRMNIHKPNYRFSSICKLHLQFFRCVLFKSFIYTKKPIKQLFHLSISIDMNHMKLESNTERQHCVSMVANNRFGLQKLDDQHEKIKFNFISGLMTN